METAKLKVEKVKVYFSLDMKLMVKELGLEIHRHFLEFNN